MSNEPLKGKERTWYEYGEHTNHENIETKCFNKSAIKSALNWMIQIHEEKIETLIKTLACVDWDTWDTFNLINAIKNEYESIMILQEGLSDVV